MTPPKRPARREFGQLDQLPSGRWRARFTGPDGRRITAPLTFATRREGADYLARTRAELLAGNVAPVVPTMTTLEAYAAEYLRTAATTLRPRTLDLYRRLTARYLLPAVGTGADRVELGPLPLSALSLPLIRQWHTAALEQARTHAEQAARRREVRRRSRAHPARAWALAEGLEVAATGRLSPAVLEAWQAAGSPGHPGEQVDDSAGRTVTAQAYRLLRTMLAQAEADGLIPSNPCKVKGAATVQHAERLPLTPEQVSALAEAVPARFRAAVLVAAWSGLRPGELFALRRADVDAAARTVTVRRAMVDMPGAPVSYGPPKTRAGARTVSLPASVAATLAEHLEAHTGEGAEALVFTTRAGGPVRSGERSRVLRAARERIERPDMTWHHLRHTGATLAAIAGATQAELQARIGHSSTRAAAIYQHARSERDRWIADQLDALAAPTPAGPEPTPPAPLPTAPAPALTPAEREPEPLEPSPAPAVPSPRPARSRAHLSLVRSA
ncbi:site-specific integrase [Brachybacterium sp. J144]|uniref:site-specific integrase n=1 Tax=Brachybacterium sp. J144 TaxID=3116487 RepID=UPI002E78EDBB|nr:site-specific integrase [Brachybacterium sp. J144]MEE1651781.1 site-specific integrase [Brachybacterium sp. J144]